METKRNIQFVTKSLVFILTVVLFSNQALYAASNSASTAGKSQNKNQSQKEAPSVQKQKPSMTPLSFNPEMPLREAINILRNSTVPPLNISVMWNDLNENADITQDTPIGMDGIPGATIKTHIELLLLSLSGGGLAELGYVVKDGVVIIGTKDALPKNYVSRTYDIADIVAPPAGTMMGGMGMMGMGMGGMGMNMGMGMSYGMGMSPYGMNGMNGSYGGYNQYNNQGYYNQGYLNQGYQNQNYLNPGYNNMNVLNGIGLAPLF